MSFVIVKINKNKKLGYVNKNYYGGYMLDTFAPNMMFNTEEAATNFIFHNYDFMKNILENENESFYVLQYNKSIQKNAV